MLLEPPNQLLLPVALGGPIGPVGPIEAVESNGNSTELYGRFYSNTTGLEGSICHLNRCCYGHQILGCSSTVDSYRSVGLEDRSGSCGRIGSLV